jgi:hypothetical protein
VNLSPWAIIRRFHDFKRKKKKITSTDPSRICGAVLLHVSIRELLLIQDRPVCQKVLFFLPYTHQIKENLII